MQKRKSECWADRPWCSIDPAHRVHRHGWYERYAQVNGEEKESVERFLCCPCGRTISVLPTHRLPYVAMPTEQLEGHFDAQAQEAAPPPATEKEKGCAKRAWARFAQRVDALTGYLGQMIEVVKPTAAALCRRRREPDAELPIRNRIRFCRLAYARKRPASFLRRPARALGSGYGSSI